MLKTIITTNSFLLAKYAIQLHIKPFTNVTHLHM